MEHNPYQMPSAGSRFDEQAASRPSKSATSSKRKRTAFRTVMFATPSVAAFLALRQYYVQNHSGLLETTISRAHHLPPLFAVAASVFWFLQFGDPGRKLRSQVLRAGVAGCIAGLIVTLALGIEIAEGVRSRYPEYWNWIRDIDDFAIILIRESLICFAVGTAAAVTCYILAWVAVRSIRDNAVQ